MIYTLAFLYCVIVGINHHFSMGKYGDGNPLWGPVLSSLWPIRFVMAFLLMFSYFMHSIFIVPFVKIHNFITRKDYIPF